MILPTFLLLKAIMGVNILSNAKAAKPAFANGLNALDLLKSPVGRNGVKD